MGDEYTLEPVEHDSVPAPKPIIVPEDNTPFRFAPGSTTQKSAPFDPCGSDEPAKRTEFHFFKSLQLDDEDKAEEPGSFRKRRTDFSVGTHVRWLKAAKTFVITKALCTAKGLWLIHGTKDDDSGTIMGIFSPSELAALPARF